MVWIAWVVPDRARNIILFPDFRNGVGQVPRPQSAAQERQIVVVVRAVKIQAERKLSQVGKAMRPPQLRMSHNVVGLDAAPPGIEIFRDKPAMTTMRQVFAAKQAAVVEHLWP